MLKPKPNPQQQLRDWQRRLRQECRNIERQIRGSFLIWVNFILCFYLVFMDFGFLGVCLIFEIVFSNLMGLVSDIQREEKSVQKAIRDAAKRNDMGSAKVYTSNNLAFHSLFEFSISVSCNYMKFVVEKKKANL